MFFSFVTLSYKPFTMIQDRWEMVITKVIREGKVNSYPVLLSFLLFIVPQ